MSRTHLMSTETLRHYCCGFEDCGRWWSIGDGPGVGTKLHCPRCGRQAEVADVDADMANYPQEWDG